MASQLNIGFNQGPQTLFASPGLFSAMGGANTLQAKVSYTLVCGAGSFATTGESATLTSSTSGVFTPMVHKNFDGLTNGQSVFSTGSVAGKNWDAVPDSIAFAGGFGVQASTAVARPGKTSSCALSIKAGGDGDPGGGDTGTGMGAFGGYVNITTPIPEGGDVWWGAWMFFPTGWSWDSPTHNNQVKFMRWQHSGGTSHMDIYILNGNYSYGPQETYAPGAGIQSGFAFRNEYDAVINADTDFTANPSGGGGVIPLNSWVWVEQYVHATATAANAIRRRWVNGVFVAEQVGNTAKWRDHTGTIKTKTLSAAIFTLQTSSDTLLSAAHFTYWNSYAPRDQTCYIGDVVIHNNGADLSATDEFGNLMMGTGAF